MAAASQSPCSCTAWSNQARASASVSRQTTCAAPNTLIARPVRSRASALSDDTVRAVASVSGRMTKLMSACSAAKARPAGLAPALITTGSGVDTGLGWEITVRAA